MSVACLGSDMSFTAHARIFTRGLSSWTWWIVLGSLPKLWKSGVTDTPALHDVGACLLCHATLLSKLPARSEFEKGHQTDSFGNKQQKTAQANPANSGFAGRISRTQSLGRLKMHQNQERWTWFGSVPAQWLDE